jgi:hypothetical protein
MKLQDAVMYMEDAFTCEIGLPWRWADLGMTKPYQTLTFDMDVPALHDDEDKEHRLVARLIANIDLVKKAAGYARLDKPKMYWRWQDKVRIVDDEIITRIYIDGSPGYKQKPPSHAPHLVPVA